MEENAEVKVSEATENSDGIGPPAAGAGVDPLPPAASSPMATSPPIIVFLNSAAGGKMGPKVLEKIRLLIPESQLFDLQEVKEGKWKPEDKLKLFQHVKGTKVLICGGDGTMGWILSCIDRLHMSAASDAGSSTPAASPGDGNFNVAMMPLGTGNDLSRTYGWGPGFARSMLRPKFLERVKSAVPAKLDRWLLSVMPYEPLGDDVAIKKTKIPPTFSLHRYASAIGNPNPINGGMNDFGPMPDTSEHTRTQSVLRMGRSFSVKMSTQAKSVHEEEMNRSSSQGSRSLSASLHGHREASFRGSVGGGDFKTEETAGESEASSATGSAVGGLGAGPSGMARASSAPPVLRYTAGGGGGAAGSSGAVFAMPTVGEVVDGDGDGVDPAERETGDASSTSSYSSSAAAAAAAAAANGTDGTSNKAGAAAGVVAADATAPAAEGVGVSSTGESDGSTVAGGGDEAAMEGSTAVAAMEGSTGGRKEEAKTVEAERESKGAVVGAATEARAGAGAVGGRQGEEKMEEKGEGRYSGSDSSDGVKREVAVQTERTPRRTGPMPRAMPSISVIQRFETWESYDAVFCNYFSFGVDAVAASAFHEYRQDYPQLFTSRCRNQAWYVRKGFPAAGGFPCGSLPPPPPVSKYLELRVKRTREGEWEKLKLGNTMRGVVVLNLQSYGGGRNLWGTAESGCAQMQYAKAAPDDGLLEIVGITNIFKLGCIMGMNKLGARAHRIAQAVEVELRIRAEIHMQIDGEPWKQAPAKINIQHYGQSTCLHGRRS